MYMYIIIVGKVCTHVKTCRNALLARILAFYRNNDGSFFLLHTPIQVDVTVCFWPISCVCSICICQVAFELYCVTCSNFRMQKFSKSLLSEILKIIFLKTKQEYSWLSLLLSYSETLALKMPHSVWQFRKYSHSKIVMYMIMNWVINNSL